MKSNALEAQVYLSVVVLISMAALFWMILQPTAFVFQQESLIIGASLFAIVLEALSPSLPYFGAVNGAGAFYIFLIFLHVPVIAALIALFATALRTLSKDRGAFMLRMFSPFHRLLCVEVASLPFFFIFRDVARPLVEAIYMVSAPLYFVTDALTEGTVTGLVLPEEEQRGWFKGRYRTLILVLIFPLLGIGMAALRSNLVALLSLTVAVVLLQFVAGSLLQKEMLETTSPLVDALRQTREKLQVSDKQREEIERGMAQKTLELDLLLDFGKTIGSNLTLDYAFQVILDVLRKFFRYQSCIVFFTHSSAHELVLRPQRFHTPYKDFCKNLHVRFGESIVGMAAKEKFGLVTDARRSVRFSPLIENEQSEMAVPLIVENRVRGVIYVGQAAIDSYGEKELQLLSTIAVQAAVVLIYAESYEYTVALASTDGLTGLYTHRYFQERLVDEVKRSERYHQALSLIMLDLDHFKEYNDTYGHPMGDALLKRVSQILMDCTRESDVVSRYGGDEFAILLLETTKETAMKTARRIQESMELRINLDKDSLVKVTTSIGVASFPEDASDKQSLLNEADKALYEGKHLGRNRIIDAGDN